MKKIEYLRLKIIHPYRQSSIENSQFPRFTLVLRNLSAI